ncbi:MAG TPA: DUF5678 domain-containing protein [Blastocatellia bacterium]|nr:DUF5678 domain-containing protein [Blastocatellia bacterium]
MTTLEQVIEAARALPPEDQRRLREWLQEQERQAAENQQRQEAVRQEVEKFHKAMKWIEENRAQYLGQWVALDGDRLISHGPDARQVHNEAKAAGIKIPFVERVTEEDNLPFCGGWLP